MHRFHFSLTAVLLALAVTACQPAGAGDPLDDVPEAERFGGTAVVGGFGDLQGLNPLTVSDNNSQQVMREMLFTTLVRYDENLRIQPYLAERWDTVRVHTDSLELTFHLRRDIRWHDGTPTTADDVVFTFDRMNDERTAFPNHQRLNHYYPRAQKVDDHTVRMRLRAHADFLDIFGMAAIAPAHILGEVRPEELLAHPFQHSPVGNGPFRFVSRVAGQEWIFEANPDFTEALGGRPYLDRLVWRVIPEETTLMTELLTGRIDVYLQPHPSRADALRAANGVELRTNPTRQYNYLAYNTALPIFQDPRTRRAITMAIDREQIVDALVYGFGEAGRATVTPTHYGYDPEAVIPYDPEGARQLLAEAGWTPGRDGILRDAQGRQLRFTIITNQGNDLRRDMAEVIQAQLRPLGIVAQPRLVEWTSMIQQLQGTLDAQGDRRRDFETAIGGWVNWEQKDDSGLLHSRNLNGLYQYVNFANPRVDELLDTLIIEMDRQRAMPLWREYQALLAHEAPYTVLYYPERLNAIQTRLRGVLFDVRGELNTVTQWWIHPSGRSGPGVRGPAPAQGGAGAPAR
jgi:peptide/nickel transport system substrate-binding protein